MKFAIMASLLLGIHANAAVLFSDLGTGGSVYSSDPGAIIKGSGAGGSSITQARPFLVSGTGDFDVSQIDLAVWNQVGNPAFTAAIFTDIAGLPGVSLGSWTLTATTFGACCALASQSGIAGVTLTGGTTYFMAAGPTVLTNDTDYNWQPNSVGYITPLFASLNGGATWIPDSSGAGAAFDVLGDPAAASTPEPESFLLLGTALAGLLFRRGALKLTHALPVETLFPEGSTAK